MFRHDWFKTQISLTLLKPILVQILYQALSLIQTTEYNVRSWLYGIYNYLADH